MGWKCEYYSELGRPNVLRLASERTRFLGYAEIEGVEEKRDGMKHGGGQNRTRVSGSKRGKTESNNNSEWHGERRATEARSLVWHADLHQKATWWNAADDREEDKC